MRTSSRIPSEPASRLIWIYAIAMGAFQGVTAILALFLAERFGVTEKTIGFFFTYIGVISVVTRALDPRRMVDQYGEAKLSRVRLGAARGRPGGAAVHPSDRDPQRVADARRRAAERCGVAAVPPARARGRADSARHRVHVPVRDGAALARDPEQRARTLHGRAADVRRRSRA